MNRKAVKSTVKPNSKERLSLKNDFLFKRMFGEQESKELLIGLLNAILGRTGRHAIKDVVIISDKKLTGKRIDAKEGILDVYCETFDNEIMNVEMQVQPFPDMEKRSMYYVGKMFVDSLDQGESHSDLKKTIAINLLDYSLLPLNQFHSTFHLYEDRYRDYMLTDVWEIHFIEMRKFRKQTFNINDPLHRWLRFIGEKLNSEQLEELMSMDPVIHKAEERMKELSADKVTRYQYLSREKAIRDQISLVKAAEKAQEELRKGKKEMLKAQEEVRKAKEEARKAKEEGVQKGLETGLKTVALNMLREGTEVELISKLTGLTQEQIQSLHQS